MGNSVTNDRIRLESWKEIAAFLGRDERTVNRWEKELGLPVHRFPGKSKGRVYAFADELSSWMENSSSGRTAEPVRGGTAGVAALAEPDSLLATSVTEPHVGGSFRYLPVGLTLIVLLSIGVASFIAARHIRGTTNSPAADASLSHGSQSTSRPHSPEAQDLYLKGRYYWNKRTPDDLNKAVSYFTQALVHDPNYADAYVGLANCYNLLREYSRMPAQEAYSQALTAAQRAVEIDDHSSDAHASLGFALFYGKWDVPGSDREFKRAVELDPANATAHHWYATYLATVQRLAEALSEIERARAIDPYSASILADRGYILFIAGKQHEAVTLLKQLEEGEPNFVSPHRYLKYAYLSAADYPNYLAEFRKESQLLHDDSGLAVYAAALSGFAAGGKKSMLQAMLPEQQKLLARGVGSPFWVAQTCALLGNEAQAMHYLQIARDQHDDFVITVEGDPAFALLRRNPAYRQLISSMGLPEQN